MARPKFVLLPCHSPEAFAPVLGIAEYARVAAVARQARERFAGRAIWHVSSTLRGGGVAEMLRSLLPYVRGAGVDTRWAVLREDPEFFRLTKRLHNNLHGDPGDGGPLGADERALYGRTLGRSARHFDDLIRAEDVVFLHDPQTAGPARHFRALGATVVWRCHIGIDHPGETALRAQRFLLPDVEAAGLCVFSRRGLVWDGLEPDPAAARLVAQVSRRDRLKDPEGLIECLAGELATATGIRLLLAGPESRAVADDPEGTFVWNEVRGRRRVLPEAIRRRVHLAGLPMADLDENAVVVNAIQRRADVVVQRSLAEGFGLTVAEAMWKRRPVIGSRIGGIGEQIVDGESGLLVDPRDPRELADAILGLLGDPNRATHLGAAAHDRVRRRYLGIVRPAEYGEMLGELEAARA